MDGKKPRPEYDWMDADELDPDQDQVFHENYVPEWWPQEKENKD